MCVNGEKKNTHTKRDWNEWEESEKKQQNKTNEMENESKTKVSASFTLYT